MSEDAPEIIAAQIVEPANESDVEARIAALEAELVAQASVLIDSAENSKNIAAVRRMSTLDLGVVARVMSSIKLARGTGQRTCMSFAYDGVPKVLELFRNNGYNVIVQQSGHERYPNGILHISW